MTITSYTTMHPTICYPSVKDHFFQKLNLLGNNRKQSHFPKPQFNSMQTQFFPIPWLNFFIKKKKTHFKINQLDTEIT